MALEELNAFLGLPAFMWAIVAFAMVIVMACLVMVHETFIMTSFAKSARKLKRSRGLPAFIQFGNTVKLIMSKNDLPEGIHQIGGMWFLRSQVPYTNDDLTLEKVNPKAKKDDFGDPLSEEDRKTLKMILNIPVLEGVGKPVLFGCINQPLLANLETIAHADLTKIREIVPATITQTTMFSLVNWAETSVLKRFNKETKTWILAAICVIGVIAALGLVVYLLTQKPPTA